jgi:hypothetical protein
MEEHLRHRGPTPVDPAFESDVNELMHGAVDIHCHSGPSAMPRVVSHRDQMVEASEAGFSAVLYKDHFYPGMAHARLLNEMFPDNPIKLFSGVALNNSNGGINPHAVDHCLVMGGKIVWMPTLSAANHVAKHLTAAKNFPTTHRPMMAQDPVTILDANGKITDATLKCIDLIAEGDIILAGGHLHVSEQYILWDHAKQRGVKKMMVNHPTYLIDCTDEDMRQFVSMGVMMEHSICMFVEGRSQMYSGPDLKHLIDNVGVDNTILSGDLGLLNAPHPVEGFRQVANILLQQQYSKDEIRKLLGSNAKKMLNWDQLQAA